MHVYAIHQLRRSSLQVLQTRRRTASLSKFDALQVTWRQQYTMDGVHKTCLMDSRISPFISPFIGRKCWCISPSLLLRVVKSLVVPRGMSAGDCLRAEGHPGVYLAH